MKNNSLNLLRQKIDVIDVQILELLAQRMELVLKVGIYKKEQNILPLDENRWQEVLSSKIILAEKLRLDKNMVKDIYNSIHKTALNLESKIKSDIKR